MTALGLGLQDAHSDVSSAALLALGETCSVLEVNSLRDCTHSSHREREILSSQGEISKYSVQLLPHLMELMMKPENMQNHNLKVIRIYYAVEELIGVLGQSDGGSMTDRIIRFIADEEHQGSIPEVLRVLFHVHASTTNTKVRELVLAVYPAIGRNIHFISFPHFSFLVQQR